MISTVPVHVVKKSHFYKPNVFILSKSNYEVSYKNA